MKIAVNRGSLLLGVLLFAIGAVRMLDYYHFGRAVSLVTYSSPAAEGEIVFYQALAISVSGLLLVGFSFRKKTNHPPSSKE